MKKEVIFSLLSIISFAVFPESICFDGSFLWVGEMKWSNRLVRFSVK